MTLRMPRPLDRLPSIRLKLAAVIVFAVGLTVLLVFLLVGYALSDSAVTPTPGRGVAERIGSTFEFIGGHWWQFLLGGGLAAALALAIARLLALGLTRPLRDMARAAGRMAQGDYGARVEPGSPDEVGQLAAAFNRMSGELANVERLRRDLVANVSHELKTPISALRAHLENMFDGVERPDPDALQVMLQQCDRLSRLVEQLLDLSRLESGDVLLERRPVRLADLVAEVVSEVRVGSARDVLVDVDVDPGLPPLLADRERLHQVLFNLLDNAVRFARPGGGVTVRARAAGSRCAVAVEDHGPGIPAEHLPFVFERFYRVDPSRARGDGGTGIGLAIARSVVEGHGGRIWVESKVGRGSVFRFEIPFASAGTLLSGPGSAITGGKR